MSRPRRIQFSEPLVREISGRVSLCPAEKQSLHYAPSDLQKMRSDASALVKRVRQNQDLTNELSYGSVVKRAYGSVVNDSIPSTEDIKMLVQWGNYRPSRRGLEQFCVLEVTEAQRQRRFHAIQVIMEIQQSTKDYSPEQRAETLSKVAENLGRIPKVYARFMGIVDASIAKDVYTSGNKRKSIAGDPNIEESQPHKRLRVSQ